MQLLNLDDLSAPKKTVQIENIEYPIAEQSLGQLIDLLNEQKKLKTKHTESDVATALLKQAQMLLPTCPVEKLRALNVRQLNALINFARASDEEILEGVGAAVQAKVEADSEAETEK